MQKIKVIDVYQTGKKSQSHSKRFGTPAKDSERHCPQMKKTWNSSKPSQVWLSYQNYSKSVTKTH